MIALDKILRLQSLMTEYQRIIDENGTQWTPVEDAEIIGRRIKKIYQGLTKEEKKWYNENNLSNINLTLIDLPGKIKRNRHYFPFYDSYSHRKEYFGDYFYPTEFIKDSNQHLYKFIPIPKNASFWVADILMYLNWTNANIFEQDCNLSQEYNIVVLRDPIERWLSGISSYLTKHHRMFVYEMFQEDLSENDFLDFVNRSSIIQLIFEKISFNLSTERQTYFLHGLDQDKTIYFYLDENFSNNFSKFFSQELKIDNYFGDIPPENPTFEEGRDTTNSILYRNFQKIIQLDRDYFNILKKYYQQDYEFIKNVNFYK